MRSKITLINYADEKYQDTQKICSITGKVIGKADNVLSFSPDDIDEEFFESNKQILENRRGAGLWLWKPYFIYKTLKGLNDGDYLFYCDSGAFFVGDINRIIKSMTQDIWVADLPLIEKQWTKPICFNLMGLDSNTYKDSNQIQASFLCIRKSEYSMIFVQEWLRLCCNYDLISPEEANVTGTDSPFFIAHREDQSLLSLLCKKEGIRPHKDPSQFGRYPEGYKQPNYLFRETTHYEDNYKTIIILHRLKKVNKKAALKSYLIGKAPRFISDKLFWRKRR